MKTKRRVRRCTRKSDGASRPNCDATERRTKDPSSLFGSAMMVGGLSRAFCLFKVRILIYAALRRECQHLIQFLAAVSCWQDEKYVQV